MSIELSQIDIYRGGTTVVIARTFLICVVFLILNCMYFVLKLINAYARFLSFTFPSNDAGDFINGFSVGDPRSILGLF